MYIWGCGQVAIVEIEITVVDTIENLMNTLSISPPSRP